ncbi:hypothetical protein V8F33_011829 [Rhypophila sp. PSN 637]
MKPSQLLVFAIFSMDMVQGVGLQQCRIACRSGEEAMYKICRRLPQPALRAVCWTSAVGLKYMNRVKMCENACFYLTGG